MSTLLKRTKAAAKAAKPGKKTKPDEETEATADADEAEDDADADDAASDAGEADDASETDESDDDADADDVDDGSEDADAADDEFDFEDDDDVEEAEPGDRMRMAKQVLVVLALVALVLSGAVFYLLHRVNDARAADEAGDEAISAARAHAQDLLSYDYRSLDSDFQRGLAATTGGFHKQYQQTTSQLVRPQATKQKVIVQAAVMNAGLISAGDDNATVLLFVDRVTTKAGQKKPTFNQDRVRMSMTKVNGKWLVSKLDAL